MWRTRGVREYKNEDEPSSLDGRRRSRPDVAALRLTREESRAVLDHQIATLNDLDDKVMRTVRTDVILIGILASAAGIAGPERLNELDFSVQLFSALAGGCFFQQSSELVSTSCRI